MQSWQLMEACHYSLAVWPIAMAARWEFMMIIEVRDSRTGYFIPARYGLGVWPDMEKLSARHRRRRRRRRRRHLE